MKFNIKKIISVAASAMMLGSTLGIAAAATYPAPFVESGTAAGAVVVGANAAASDWSAAIDLSQSLNNLVTTSSSASTGSVAGEGYALFTGSAKLYYNDSMNAVRSSLTDTELPTILADGSFEGDESADFTQTITLDHTAKMKYDKQPNSNDEPVINVYFNTNEAHQIYNMTVTFDKGINFSHADSKKQDITLFGQKFTVGTATTSTKGIVLYKSSETVDLTIGGSDPNPSQTVSIGGEDYVVELTSATDTSAVVKVTDSSGASDTKEITEGASKKIQGVEVAVNLAHSSTATDSESAEITVGAEKLILKTAQTVKIGSEETSVRGTKVFFNSAVTAADDITSIVISVWEHDADADAMTAGGNFIDPVFGTFKLDFTGVNVPVDSSARETLSVAMAGNDKAKLTMTNYQGDTGDIYWYYNKSCSARLADSSGNSINIMEEAEVNESEYVILGNEDEGYLVEVSTIENGSLSTGTDSLVRLTNVFDTTETWDATVDAVNSAYTYVGGKKYTVDFWDDDAKSGDEYVRINYPDSATDATQMILFPSIQTSKGAKVIFYEPTAINVSSWDRSKDGGKWKAPSPSNLTTIYIPDGKDYGSALTVTFQAALKKFANMSIDGGVNNITNCSVAANKLGQVTTEAQTGQVRYNFTWLNYHVMKAYLLDPDGSGNVKKPAIIVLEEEDDNNVYEGVVIKMAGGGDSNSPVGVNDVQMTYATGDDGATTEIGDFKQGEADQDVYTYMDLWGTLVTVDKSDSDSYTATLSYPDEQIYAQVYAAEQSASITAAQAASGAGGKVLVVKDSEVSSASDKNLVVVGGSCINSVAAKILGSDTPVCGGDFSDLTNVAAGQYLIKTVTSPYNADKIAMLVAGYDADDTTDAVAKAKTGVATDVETSQVYPIASA